MFNFFFKSFFKNDGIMYVCCLRVLTCTLVRDCCCSCCMFSFAFLFLILICISAVYVSAFAVLFVLFSLYTLFVFFYENSRVSERCICFVTWLTNLRCRCAAPVVNIFYRRRRTTVLPEIIVKTPVTTCTDIVIIQSCGEPKMSLGIAQN